MDIARIRGIPIRVHWTFGLLMLFIAWARIGAGGTLLEALGAIAFLLLVFVCVALHELGHALTAQRFGIRTRAIILLPLGGVAQLERLPEAPRQELLIALAGPAVNGALAVILLALSPPAVAADPSELPVLLQLAAVNLMLALFNLLPAFPMDGGRVLRALLAARSGDRLRATLTAARVGRALAIPLGLLGLFFNPMLILIAIFVYAGAGAEARAALHHDALRRRSVADAMQTRVIPVPADLTIEAALSEARRSGLEVLPVHVGDRLVGVVTWDDLARLWRRSGPGTSLAAAIHPADVFSPQMPLERAWAALGPRRAALVVENGRLVGLLTRSQVERLLLLGGGPGAAPPRHKAVERPPPPGGSSGLSVGKQP